jgi:mannitol-specific phosphotransferase system IIBC component
MSWMMLFAVLLAPGTALGDPGVIAPASIGVVYAIMMKDTTGAITNMLPILVVLVVGLFVGFVWQLIRGAFESSLDKARSRTAEDTQATMQLTTGNYLTENVALDEQPVADKPETQVNLEKDSTLAKNSDNKNIDKR